MRSHEPTGLAYVDMAPSPVETAQSGDNPIIDLPAQLMTSDTAPPYLVLFIQLHLFINSFRFD